MPTETAITNGEQPMLDNTEETTKAILTSIAQSLADIAVTMDMLNGNVERLADQLELVTGTYTTSVGGEFGFVRISKNSD
jgi:hypothetical protein